MAGTVAQTISDTIAPAFNNITINNSSGAAPGVTVASNNVLVSSNLTLTAGLVNLSGNTLTLGASAASTGTLNYTTGAYFVWREFRPMVSHGGSDAGFQRQPLSTR